MQAWEMEMADYVANESVGALSLMLFIVAFGSII